MGKPKSQFQIYLEYLPFAAGAALLSRLSFRRCRRWAEFLLGLLFYIDRKHRRRTVEHILHAGVCRSRSRAVRLARACYRASGDLLAEILFFHRCFRPEKVTFTGPAGALDRVLPSRDTGEPRQVILAMAHYGNWEISCNAAAALTGVKVTSIMRPFSNPKIGDVIMKSRLGPGHVSVDKHLGARPLLRALNEGQTVVILIDQHAGHGEGTVCTFFGHPAKVHKTPALLHLKTGVPILPAVVWRDPSADFKFEIRCGELIRYEQGAESREEAVARITQMSISALEKLIRRAPAQWLWAPRHWLDIDRNGKK